MKEKLQVLFESVTRATHHPLCPDDFRTALMGMLNLMVAIVAQLESRKDVGLTPAELREALESIHDLLAEVVREAKKRG